MREYGRIKKSETKNEIPETWMSFRKSTSNQEFKNAPEEMRPITVGSFVWIVRTWFFTKSGMLG